jgi:undecaprenyl-diphosphatase
MHSLLAQAVLLGVLQGLTEFLPVSSSGHLALAQQMIPGFNQPGVLLDVSLHVGTLAAAVAYFRRELLEMVAMAGAMAKRRDLTEQERDAQRLVIGIVIATVPTGLIGLFLEKRVEWMFGSAIGVGVCLLITGAALIAGEMAGRARKEAPGHPGWLASLVIGIVQGIAVLPGISRSGSTISAARALGISREEAARFSFLASLPAVAGAALLSAVKDAGAIRGFAQAEALAYIAGPLAAAVVGYLAIEIVMRFMRRGSLMWFSLWCFAVGIVSVAAGCWK